MLQALHRGDRETLKALYEKEAAGRPPLDVWRAASDSDRHDLQHAVIVLHPHHNIEARLRHAQRKPSPGGGPRPLNGELHRPLASETAHASLIHHIKQFPYYSEKPGRVTDENLNGEVKFPDGGHQGHDTIFCRQLAPTWALQVLTTGKPDYDAFRSRTALQQNVPSSMQLLYERLLTGAPENRLVPLADWGPFAARQLRAMEAAGDTPSKVMLFSSGSHVMAMELKIKPEASGPRYVGNFYDPNLTAAHKRIASDDLQRFEKLRLDDLLPYPHSRDEYFRGESVVSVTGIPPGGESAIPPLKIGGDPERRITGELPPLDETVMHHLMSGGFAGTLRDIQPAFAELAKKSPYNASSLLAGRAGDVPGLFTAMMAGQAHVVHAFRELIQLVPAYRHAWLLAAQSGNNVPAVRAAAAFDHAPAVRAFVDCVAATSLPPAEQVKLLAGRAAPKDIPLLGMAMVQGHLATVNAYLGGIAAHPGLSAEIKAELLSLRNDKGSTVLAHGLQHGTPDTVAAATGWIARQDFSAIDKRSLLLAADNSGTPALLHALKGDDADNVQAYVSAVLASPMDEADKLHVLTAGRGSSDWLRFVADHPASPALEGYRDAVSRSSLSPSAKEQLLG